MQIKQVRIGNTVFLAQCEIEMDWGGNLKLFQTEGDADYILHVRNTYPGEETPDAAGYAKVRRNGNRFLIALPARWYVQPSLWQVLNLLPLSALLLERGTLTMHASYISYRGEGILFSGPSGIGKSTQAELWQQYRGAKVVNGDRVLITPTDNGAVVASHYLSGTSGVCSNVTSALKAIVLLEQAGENAIRTTSAWQILRLVMGQIDYDVSNREQLVMVSGLVEMMLRKTVICSYGCRIDENAVDTLEKYLYET